MTTVLDPPKVFERGTSPDRHPWFLLADGSPPVRPPDVTETSDFDEQGPTDEDQCPRCRQVRAAVCGCGYDWDNWEWVT